MFYLFLLLDFTAHLHSHSPFKASTDSAMPFSRTFIQPLPRFKDFYQGVAQVNEKGAIWELKEDNDEVFKFSLLV